MRFWDSSAVLPLLVDEPATAAMVALQVQDPAAAVWWLTPVECWSALGRLERERRLTEEGLAAAARLLAEAARRWTEAPPIDRVLDQAAPLPFVTLDDPLARAARREGFEVLGA